MVLEILLPTILPLYLLIFLGYIGAKYMDMDLHSLAVISIYFVSPVVIFGAIVEIDFQPEYVLLPFVFFIISAVIGVAFYKITNRVFADKRANLVGLTSTNGNSGYFGLPIILAFFGPEAAGLYLMITTFIEFSTNTVGYYIMARGNFSIRQSMIKVLSLPPLYGMLLGLAWNFADLPLGETFNTYWDYFAGTWVVIGMMIIGVAIGKMPYLHIDRKLLTWMMAARYLAWPVASIGFILLDRLYFQMYDGVVHTLILLIGVIPHAANSVAYAAQLKVCPEDAATVILISTCFALFFVPLTFFLMGAPF